jgi:hypothetical protein
MREHYRNLSQGLHFGKVRRSQWRKEDGGTSPTALGKIYRERGTGSRLAGDLDVSSVCFDNGHNQTEPLPKMVRANGFQDRPVSGGQLRLLKILSGICMVVFIWLTISLSILRCHGVLLWKERNLNLWTFYTILFNLRS